MSCIWFILLSWWPAVGVSVLDLQGWSHVLYMVYASKLMACCWGQCAWSTRLAPWSVYMVYTSKLIACCWGQCAWLQGWLHVLYMVYTSKLKACSWGQCASSTRLAPCPVYGLYFWADDLLLGQCALSTRLAPCHVLFMTYILYTCYKLIACCWVSVPDLQGWLHVMYCIMVHFLSWWPAFGSVCLIYKAGSMSWSTFLKTHNITLSTRGNGSRCTMQLKETVDASWE